MKIYEVYWMNKETRERHHGYCKANSHDNAFDIVQSRLQPGYIVTHVYEASESRITPQSLTINFPNTSEYTTF